MTIESFQFIAIVLMFIGTVLLILEIKIPTFGVLTGLGTAAFVLGYSMFFRFNYEMMKKYMLFALPFVISMAGISTFLAYSVIKSHKNKVQTGMEGMLGTIGEVTEDLRPGEKGKIFVHGETWNAISKDVIAKGNKVRVIKVNGLTLEVDKF